MTKAEAQKVIQILLKADGGSCEPCADSLVREFMAVSEWARYWTEDDDPVAE
jgi:hypothetical protein